MHKGVSRASERARKSYPIGENACFGVNQYEKVGKLLVAYILKNKYPWFRIYTMPDKVKKRILETVRIDRWLWAARFYKSRTLATKACDGGKVDVNGHGAKAHKSVKPGDLLEFSVGEWRRKVKVLQLSEKRGPASVSRLLYEDMSPPPPTKDSWLITSIPQRSRGTGRPTKKERRRLKKLRGR